MALALMSHLVLLTATAEEPSDETTVAMQTAQQTGQAVPVAELTTETSEVSALPDGTLSLVSHRGPVRVKDDGTWKPIDTTLSTNPGGRIRPERTSVGMSFSAGGDDLLATSTDGEHEVTLRTPFILPVPVLAGDTATYPEVMPGVDLVISVGAESYSEVLVVKTAQAATNPALAELDFTLTSPTLTLHTNADGSTDASTTSGQVIFTSPTPTMWTAEKSPGIGPKPDASTTGETMTKMAVASTATTTASVNQAVITLTPPAHLLTGPDVVYPVFIDPSIGPSRTDFAVVRNNGAGSYYNTTDDMRIGYCGWAGCTSGYSARSYFNFNTSALNAPVSGKTPTIYSATVNVNQTHNGSSAATPVHLYSANPINSSTVWPGPMSTFMETKSAAGATGIQFSAAAIKTYVQNNTQSQKIAFGLRAVNEVDAYQWKRFQNNPSITIKFGFPVDPPTNLEVVGATTCGLLYATSDKPTFRAKANEHNTTGPIPIDLNFQILHPTGEAAIHNVMVRTQRNTLTSWTVPTALPQGDYRLRVGAFTRPGDGTDTFSGWSQTLHFSIDKTPPGNADIRSITHPRGYETGTGNPITVTGDQGNGNFVLSVPGDTSVRGFAYAFNNQTVPSYSAQTCPATQQATSTSGFIQATNGTATLPLPAGVTGTATLYVKAIDQAGNASPTQQAGYQFIRSATTTHYQEMEGQVNTTSGLTTAAWQTNNQNILSGGSQIYVPSPTVGQKVTLNFTVPSDGNWVLQPIMVKTGFYGQVRFQIDGKDVGYTVPAEDWTEEDEFVLTTADLYSATNRFLAAHVLPVASALDAGSHTLTIISTGKNNASGDTSFTIDALRLIEQA